MPKRYLEIRRDIGGKIERGEWKVGDKVPKESELCTLYDASRTTVRRALSALVEEGRLRRVKGTGTFVKAPQIFDKTTFFIQSFAEELKSQGLTCTTEVLECRMLYAREETAARALGLSSKDRMFKLRRLRYAKEDPERGPITLTVSYFPEEIGRQIERCDFEVVSLYSALRQNGVIRAQSEKTISATRLSERDMRLLSACAEDLFLIVTTVSYDRAGKAIEYCESLYPAERYSFRLHVVTD